MTDFVFEEVSPIKFNWDAVKVWLDKIILNDNMSQGDLCFVFCSDEYLLNINKKYLNHDFYTDVITFDYTESDFISGDVFISVDRIKDNAEQFGVSFDYELLRVIVHGVLHLMGYKDKTKSDKLKMTQMEDTCLKLYDDVERV